MKKDTKGGIHLEATLMRIVITREVPGLGAKIREVRKLSEKTVTELAAEAGISTSHWHRIENEKIQELPLETLRGIERALAVDLGIEG
ncbi:helix-turn-helix domain-containing protein [Nostoc sp. CHAB 5784]|uniref:helix-turn-helix domain-containing protein n=1 Tax=Nostoc TaxID=1177 RepID=UPI001E30414F|nr:helix-turn-helix transcriptional regulator [Nostoc mirabile]MCC5664874.1 helix-turn-helix domain-containing protein [Nostoc mirabile CHAB5784]